MSETVKSIQTTTYGTLGTSFTATAVSSAFLLSPTTGVWLVMNQFQTLMLLIFTGAYIPFNVKHYLYGLTFTLLSFNFFESKKSKMFSYIIEPFDYDQNDIDLNEMGLESRSGFVNNFELLLTFIILTILSLVIFCINLLNSLCR